MKLNGLFIKIFLWFWLALALLNGGLSLVFLLTERARANRRPPWGEMHAAAMSVYAQTAADLYVRDGHDALGNYLARIEQTARLRAVVFDESGAEISGREIPAGAREMAAQAIADNGAFQFDPANRSEMGAQSAFAPDGRRYTLVAALAMRNPPPFLPPLRVALRDLAQRLLLMLLISGVFCYWLARYLTSPLGKLRATTEELTRGNLAARVEDKLTTQRDEVGALGYAFNQMAERMETLMAAQRRLLGDISHELRSPLARIGVALELARRRANPETQTMLDRIEREAENINEMIGQVLTLARVESDADALARETIDLPALVKKIVTDADFEAHSRDRAVEITLCDAGQLQGSESLLHSAVENVVRNAVRHTVAGTKVEVALFTNGANGTQTSVISVRDFGRGVPENELDKIFQPFYRVEDARDRQTGGAGLGLAIAARAIRLHHGTITASNAPDGGLLIEIQLPRNAAGDEQNSSFNRSAPN